MASIWGHLGVTLESFLAYGGALEPYLRQFDVEKHEMASVMGIYAGLVGPKSENVEKVLVFKSIFEGSKVRRVSRSQAPTERPGALSGHFEVAFLYMRVILRHFGMTSGILCGSIGYMKVFFKKHSFY